MNRLFVLPTPDTLEFFQKAFEASAFTINWDQLGVELGSSLAPIDLNEDAVYKATTGTLDIWYNSATGYSSLILPLIPSKEMMLRHRQVGDVFGRRFIPNITLSSPYAPSRARKVRVNSLATSWIDYPEVLTFHNELIVTDDSIYPANQDFYDSAVASGLGLDQFLSAEVPE